MAKKKFKIKGNHVTIAIIAASSCIIVGIIASLIVFFVNRADSRKKTVSDRINEVNDIIQNDIIGSEGTVAVEAAPQLEEIVKINQLHSLSYNYDSIKRVRGGSDREVVYYVAYEATVNLGVDFEQIEFVFDETEKNITIVLPELSVQSANINSETLDFIFYDNSYDNPQTVVDAYSICEEDLYENIGDEEELFEIARTNTENEIKALISPFIDEFYPEYSVNIIWQSIETEAEEPSWNGWSP